MLIDFTVENFRSYREAKTFSLVASAARELPENLAKFPGLDHSLVCTAAIYGANASGKSNLLEAMNALSELLTNPAERSFMEEFDLPPFALDSESKARPSRFKVRFLLDSILYEYSIAARPGLIETERLAVFPAGRQQEWFSRSGMDISYNRTHLKGPKERLGSITGQNLPFLAVAATFGHPQLTPPARWIGTNLRRRVSVPYRPGNLMRGGGGGIHEVTQQCAVSPEFHEWVNAFLRHADLGIQRLEIEARDDKRQRQVTRRGADGKPETLHEEVVVRRYDPYFVHKGDHGFSARFSIADESHGTQRLFSLLSPLYRVQKGQGQVLVIDEFGESMHPSLAREIVRLFQDAKTNPHWAQLIFTTHDTSLLSSNLFRRDQIWFTEKAPSGATDLYSLHDIKDVREGEPFEKGYLRGRYGAIPFFGPFDFSPCEENAASSTSTTEGGN